MKSFAAYYALVALSDAQQEAERRRRAARAARPPRPSILARARMLVSFASGGPAQRPEPASTSA
jgi:hypothetical protein